MRGAESEDEMDGSLVRPKRRWGGTYRGMSVEVRLLYVSCLCFMVAQYVVNERPWDAGFRIVALLALIVAQLVGLRTRRRS